MKDYIYVDFENLSNLNKLETISGKYIFFIGSNQVKLNSDLVVSSNSINVEWIKISGTGKNALDFHIVYYLSKYDEEENVRHFILSKDTGFDPLIKHLCEKGKKVKRIINVNEVFTKNNQITELELVEYKKCYENIMKIDKAKRPKTLKSLTSCFKSLLGNEKEKLITTILEEMFRNKIINSSDNNRLKYLT